MIENATAADWITPEWPAIPGVRAACSTRRGGVSDSHYASLNLGEHVGDEPAAVAHNRARAAAHLGARPVYLRQVHGARVLRVDAGTRDGEEADACVTTARGTACTIMVADCMPLLFAHESGRAVAAAHAGWRGLAGGAIESAVAALAAAAGEPLDEAARHIRAWLGPCIGPRQFEVGDDVRSAFAADGACFARHPNGVPGKWLADLPALSRRRLATLGVASVWGNDGSDDWCTVSRPLRFFSHRRDRVSGRFAAFIWLE